MTDATQTTTAANPATAFEYAGIRIYPITVGGQDGPRLMWAVESCESREKRLAGQRHGFGDTLHPTRDSAIGYADVQARQEAARAELKREAEQAQALAESRARARAEEIKGLSLSEVRALDYLKKSIRDSEGRVLSRAQWIATLLAEGAVPKVLQVDKVKPMSRMAHFRATGAEQQAHERRRAAAGKRAEYMIGPYVVSKIEYDHALRLSGTTSTEDLEANAAR